MNDVPEYYLYHKYYFHQDNKNNLLHLNDCYKFIWKEFDDEYEAQEALNDLASMLFKSFGGSVNVELELRKKYVIKMGVL